VNFTPKVWNILSDVITKHKRFATWYHSRFLLSLFFDPEGGGDMFLRNVGSLSTGLHGVVSQKTKLLLSSFCGSVCAALSVQCAERPSVGWMTYWEEAVSIKSRRLSAQQLTARVCWTWVCRGAHHEECYHLGCDEFPKQQAWSQQEHQAALLAAASVV
jgi:hypothetical protein